MRREPIVIEHLCVASHHTWRGPVHPLIVALVHPLQIAAAGLRDCQIHRCPRPLPILGAHVRRAGRARSVHSPVGQQQKPSTTASATLGRHEWPPPQTPPTPNRHFTSKRGRKEGDLKREEGMYESDESCVSRCCLLSNSLCGKTAGWHASAPTVGRPDVAVGCAQSWQVRTFVTLASNLIAGPHSLLSTGGTRTHSFQQNTRNTARKSSRCPLALAPWPAQVGHPARISPVRQPAI